MLEIVLDMLRDPDKEGQHQVMGGGWFVQSSSFTLFATPRRNLKVNLTLRSHNPPVPNEFLKILFVSIPLKSFPPSTILVPQPIQKANDHFRRRYNSNA
jgi:hypothetical protein